VCTLTCGGCGHWRNRGVGREVCRQLALLGFAVVLGSRDLRKGSWPRRSSIRRGPDRRLPAPGGQLGQRRLDGRVGEGTVRPYRCAREQRLDHVRPVGDGEQRRAGTVAEAIDVNLSALAGDSRAAAAAALKYPPEDRQREQRGRLDRGDDRRLARLRRVQGGSQRAHPAAGRGAGQGRHPGQRGLSRLARQRKHPEGRTLAQAAASVIWAITIPNGAHRTLTRDGQPFPW